MAIAYLGEIRLFAGNFAPKGNAFCNGQLLPISQNPALFSLLGTTYGGDGRITFALPDLRGRSPAGTGQGPGLNNINLGQAGGAESVELEVSDLPPHSHGFAVPASTSPGNTATPDGASISARSTARDGIYTSATANTTLGPPGTTSAVGSGTPVPIRSPYLGLSYIIALVGIFPSRS